MPLTTKAVDAIINAVAAEIGQRNRWIHGNSVLKKESILLCTYALVAPKPRMQVWHCFPWILPDEERFTVVFADELGDAIPRTNGYPPPSQWFVRWIIATHCCPTRLTRFLMPDETLNNFTLLISMDPSTLEKGQGRWHH
jgi:hypothetical protein